MLIKSQTRFFSFDNRDENNPNSPFPDEISDDALTLYHGTSGANEALIEHRGLIPGESLFTLEQLRAISTIFRDLSWANLSMGSLCVLEPFSIQHDFERHEVKPVYLAESARRAAMFASREFAGGEIARTVRICLSELWRYAKDPSVRETHMNELRADADYCKMVGAPAPSFPKISVDELAQRLRQLDKVSKAASQAKEQYERGVVYAIKLPLETLRRSEIHQSMGVKCFEALLPGLIVGKALVSKEYEPALYDGEDPLHRVHRHAELNALAA